MYGAVQSALSDLDIVGFTCIQGLISAAQVAGLRAEALHNRKDAKAVSDTSSHGYQAHLSGLGDAGHAFLSSCAMTALIDALFDMPLVPDRIASCYTYYQPGDFLGAHIDHPQQCPVTAILYLDVVRPEQRLDRTGLELHILTDAPSGGCRILRTILPTQTGALILGLGSVTWHERPPLQDGEHLIAMTACYSAPPAASP